jgi:hypothetical protein
MKVDLYLKYQFFLLIDFPRYYITIKDEFYVLSSNSFKVLLIQQNVTIGSLRLMYILLYMSSSLVFQSKELQTEPVTYSLTI